MIFLNTMSDAFERLSRCEFLKITIQIDVNKTYVK